MACESLLTKSELKKKGGGGGKKKNVTLNIKGAEDT